MRSEQKPGPVQNSRLKRALLDTPDRNQLPQWLTNKCLAESNKSKTMGAIATKKRAIRLRRLGCCTQCILRTGCIAITLGDCSYVGTVAAPVEVGS